VDYTLFVIQLLNGLQLGILLFLVASGLTLVFGILDFVNLAHGSVYMLGAFICASLTFALGNFVYALLISLPIVAVIGYGFERLIARPLYERDHLDHVLGTFGAILVIDTLGLIAAAGLYWLVNHTRTGMLIRAGASNRTMVTALGVDIQALFSFVFAIGAALAGLAGMLIAPITEASLGMGNNIIITAFVVIIVGGFLDDIFKLFMSSSAAENSAPAISSMSIYLIMASILFFRPQGLFPPKLR